MEKTAAEKLLIKTGRSVRLVNTPENVVELLGGIPEGVKLIDESAPVDEILRADIIVLFANNANELVSLLPGLRTALAPGGMIWVVYHKGTSKVKTDIHRDSINAYAKTIGMEGVAIISIDTDWSALRLKAQ